MYPKGLEIEMPFIKQMQNLVKIFFQLTINQKSLEILMEEESIMDPIGP